MKLILVNGKMNKEKSEQILKRYAPKKGKKYKQTLADIWPRKEVKENVKQSDKNNSS